MTKSLKPLTSKESKKARGRNGGRISLPPAEKRELAQFYLPRWLLEAFKELIPVAGDRSNLILSWVRAYVVANGESDRLLAQSSVAGEILNYLEASEAPQHLIDKLESVIVVTISRRALGDKILKQGGNCSHENIRNLEKDNFQQYVSVEALISLCEALEVPLSRFVKVVDHDTDTDKKNRIEASK